MKKKIIEKIDELVESIDKLTYELKIRNKLYIKKINVDDYLFDPTKHIPHTSKVIRQRI